MSAQNDVVVDVENREISAVRIFDAPRDLVFACWFEPAHISRWWGPKGFTTTTHEMDARPGGVWSREPLSPYPVSRVAGPKLAPARRNAQRVAGTTGKRCNEAAAVLGRNPLGRDRFRQKLCRSSLIWKYQTSLLASRFWRNRHTVAATRYGERGSFMHGPDGRDYANRVVYREIARPARLVYRHTGEGDNDSVRFEVTVVFAEKNGKTEVGFRMVFDTRAMCDEAARFGAVEGLHDTLSRLAKHLASKRRTG